MRYLFMLLLGINFTAGTDSIKAQSLKPAGEVQKIWDEGRHNAFTDLIRFKGRWFCVFREGSGHASGAGAVRVLVSKDGNDWRSAALVRKNNVDLRDPHLCVTPDNRLMINGGAAWPPTRIPVRDHYSWVSFSKDGKNWTVPQRILNSWQWLWRVTWHKGRAYGVAYSWGHPKTKNNPTTKVYRASLYESPDGLHYEKLTDFDIPNATEATVRFDNGSMLILQRRDGRPNSAMLGISKKPYKDFTWKDLGFYFGGPNFIQGPNGTWWTAGRMRKHGSKTVLGRLDLSENKLLPKLELPSGGDTSYPGMVWHENTLWVSYYSSHKGRTSIWLAKVRVTDLKTSNPPD